MCSITEQQLETYQYSFSELNIKAEKIGSLMGYGDEIPKEIQDIIAFELLKLKGYQGISGGYAVYDAILRKDNYTIQLEDKQFLVHKTIWNLLSKAEKIAIFACTAGAEISERSKKLMDKGDLLEGYVLDVMGSVIVETAMDLIQGNLSRSMETEGLKISNRYSPGYCDWDVAEQHQLFSLLPANICGISLSESALMHPIKSVSGFIGIGNSIKFNAHTCNKCNQTNCIYSKLK